MKYLLVSIAIICSSFSLAAQEQKARPAKTPADIAKMRSEHLKTKLNLNEEQTSKIYQVILDEEKEKESDRISRKARAEKNQETIKKVLTPEQLKEFNLLKEKRSDVRKQNRSKVRSHKRTPQDNRPIEK